MSTLDENGILQYDETDTRGTFSALLNMGQDATSDAIGADRARLAALEAKDALTDVNGAFGAFAAGWNGAIARARKKNGLAFVNVEFTRTGAPITVDATGDIGNVIVLTFAGGWHAAAGMAYLAAGGRTGRAVSGHVEGSAMALDSVTPGGNILTGDTLTLSAVYPLA